MADRMTISPVRRRIRRFFAALPVIGSWALSMIAAVDLGDSILDTRYDYTLARIVLAGAGLIAGLATATAASRRRRGKRTGLETMSGVDLLLLGSLTVTLIIFWIGVTLASTAI